MFENAKLVKKNGMCKKKVYFLTIYCHFLLHKVAHFKKND